LHGSPWFILQMCILEHRNLHFEVTRDDAKMLHTQ
jgi:hypothetical protein